MKTLGQARRRCIALTALPMAQASGVEERVRAVLERNRKRGMMTRKSLTVAILATVGVIVFLAVVRPVARAQVSAAAPPPLISPAPGAAVTLPDGGTVQLVRVTFPAMLQAWKSDGTPLPNAAAVVTQEGRDPLNPYGPSLRRMDEPRGWRRYVFDFDLDHLTARPGDVSIEFRPDAEVTTVTAPPKRLAVGVWRQRVTGIFDKPHRAVTLRVGIPSGPWRTVAVTGPKLGMVRAASGEAVVFTHNTINPQQLAPAARGQYGYGLHVANVPPAGQYRLLAVDRAGKSRTLFLNLWPSVGMAGPRAILAQTVDAVGHPILGIRAVRLQVRDDQWAEFRDIPLGPKVIAGNTPTVR